MTPHDTADFCLQTAESLYPLLLVLALTAIWYIWESGNTVLYDSFAQKMFSGLENYGLLAIHFLCSPER